MVKHAFKMVLILFLLSTQVMAMNKNYQGVTDAEFKILNTYICDHLVPFLDKAIKSSAHRGKIDQYIPVTAKDKNKVNITIEITFTDRVKDDNDKTAIVKLLNTKAGIFFKRKNKDFTIVNKINIRIKQDQYLTVALLDRFAKNMFSHDDMLLKNWSTISKSYDIGDKTSYLQNSFKNVIYTSGLAKEFPEFASIKNLTEGAVGFRRIPDEIDEAQLEINRKVNESSDKLVKIISLYANVKAMYKNNEISFYNIDNDFVNSIADALRKKQSFHGWSKLNSLHQFFRNQDKIHQGLKDDLDKLKNKLAAFEKYTTIVYGIFDSISDAEQKELVGYLYRPSDEIVQQNCRALEGLKVGIAELTEVVEKNHISLAQYIFSLEKALVKFARYISLVSPHHPDEITEPEVISVDQEIIRNDLIKVEEPMPEDDADQINVVSDYYDPSAEASVTKQSHDLAQAALDAENTKAEKKNLRPKNLSILDVEQNKDPGKKFKIYVEKNGQRREVEHMLFVDGTKIYISFDSEDYREDPKKRKAFLNTAKELRMLTQDNLGHPGIKNYGKFLAVKNNGYPKEHLLFFSYPIDEGKSGYIFIPHKIVTHKYYESLIGESANLKNVLKLVRGQVTVSSSQE